MTKHDRDRALLRRLLARLEETGALSVPADDLTTAVDEVAGGRRS